MKQIILKYQDFLNEANRGNYYPYTKDEFYDFINKYKGQEDLIFLSFKSSDKFVSKINIEYRYQTPQAIYTYPYEILLLNGSIRDSKQLYIDVPFGKDKPFVYVYKLKNLDGFLTFQNESDYPKALEILDKIKVDFNISQEEFDDYVNIKLRNPDQHNYNKENPISVLFTLVNDFLYLGKPQKARNVFVEYGIKGFLDEGGGFVNRLTSYQLSIYDVSVIEDYKIIDRTRDLKYTNSELTPEQKRIIENPQSVEDLEYVFSYYKLYFIKSKLKIGSDGVWEYKGAIIFLNSNFSKAPNFLKKFRYISELSFQDCKKLSDISSLKNLEGCNGLYFNSCYSLSDLKPLSNLRSVDILDIIYCRISTLDGLENITDGLQFRFDDCMLLESLKGLSNLKKIHELHFVRCKNLSNLSGLENLEEVSMINLEGCVNLKSFNGISKTTKVGLVKDSKISKMFKRYLREV